MGHLEHKKSAPASVSFAVITVSDTRGEKEDIGGRTICDMILEAGHTLVNRYWVKDDCEEIRSLVTDQLEREDLDLILLTGGSGIAERDVTVESITPIVEKRLDGFGELFRHLSYLEIGSAAMLSRAMAGVANKKIVISLPGSVKAIKLAMNKLILPEAGHMVLEARK
jgi:molybdenum cofactor biosynthesis protein B